MKLKELYKFSTFDFLLTAHFKNLRKPHLPYPHIYPTTLQLSTLEYSFSSHFTLLSPLQLSEEEYEVYIDKK